MRAVPVVALLLAGAAAAAPRAVALREVGSPRVKHIRFEHLDEKPIPNRELRAAMSTAAGRRFVRRFFRADIATIENLYRSRGYLDVDVVRPRFVLDDAGELTITLKIASGRPWHVATVRLELQDTTVTAASLDPHVDVAGGEVFEYGAVLGDERRLLSYLNTAGHAHARVQNHLDFDSGRRLVNVVYQVTAGPRMVFGEVSIEGQDSLRTRPSLIRRQLAFHAGQVYDPEALRQTRNRLASTGLFRSVTLVTPAPPAGNPVQPVQVRLRERPFLHLESRAFVNNAEPGVSAKVEDGNFLGRGNRLGADASLGQPLQGLTLFLTERRLLGSQLDLTVSAGLTDERSETRVFADPGDTTQFDLLTANHSIAHELQLFFGDADAAAFISGLEYRYASVERTWQANAVLGRRWERRETTYLANLTARLAATRNRPVAGRTIDLSGDDTATLDSTGAAPDGDEDPFGGDPFGDGTGKPLQGEFPYDDPDHPGIEADATWVRLLTDKARTANMQLDLQRDTRDDQLAPTRGNFARVSGLFAYELGGSGTRVLQGEAEARNYLHLSARLLWAQSVRVMAVGSLRRDRDLPQVYWTKLGGEGSVRGVRRESIQAAGGGRAGFNLRNELRLRLGPVGVVAFWDRAAVWRRLRQARWRGMADGFGAGLRWNPGIPLRFDVGRSDTSAKRYAYLSVGQAF